MHTPFMDKTPNHRNGVGAGGRLKQTLAQLLVRSSCTTNVTKTTTTSATAFVSLDKATAKPRQEPPHSPDWCTPCTYERPKLEESSRSRRRHRRSASVVHASTDCTGTASRRRSVRSDVPLPSSSSLPTNDAKKQSKSRSKPCSRSVSRRHCSYYSRGRAPRPPRTSTLYSCSSSTVTGDELAQFSTDDEEAETRTLFSSLSFSSDSTSEFYHTNSSTASRKSHKSAPRRAPRRAFMAAKHHQGNNMKKEEVGTVGAGIAVVKRSSNPYADFRSSMVEMVVERRVASVGKMEELLASYLSLNSPEHHPAILAAFEDIWEAVFGQAP
ncbi:unnamed protein product [Alopecurus aequalis]